jgi:hypothetical protein
MNDGDGERIGVLVLHAWVENRQRLRVRITHVVGRPQPKVTAAANVEGACAIVQEWLEELLGRSITRDPYEPS